MREDGPPEAVAAEDAGLSGTDRALYEGIRSGDETALARTITHIEDRRPGYRRLVGALHRVADPVPVCGVTGRPGSGKSTLVDALARLAVDRDDRVGVVAVDPSSPFSGGAVLGDRVRMIDHDAVFVRSMGARGALGGLSAATADAVTAMAAFGMDRIFIETVGAGQNEVEVVETADTVVVLVPPDSGDDVQMLKAGLLEIADLFVVNKADLEGADRTVGLLDQLVTERLETGGAAAWTPPILETVATNEEGVSAVLEAIDAHLAHLESTGDRARERRRRHADAIRELLRTEAGRLVEAHAVDDAGIDGLAEAVARGETDRYAVVAKLLEPLVDCLDGADSSGDGRAE